MFLEWTADPSFFSSSSILGEMETGLLSGTVSTEASTETDATAGARAPTTLLVFVVPESGCGFIVSSAGFTLSLQSSVRDSVIKSTLGDSRLGFAVLEAENGLEEEEICCDFILAAFL